MRKVLLSAIAALSIAAQANAQQEISISGTQLTDNWSITLQGGANAPLGGKLPVFPNSRGVVGLAINKEFTPNYGLTLESNWGINTSSWCRDMKSTSPAGTITSKSSTMFDYCSVSLLNRFNILNLLGQWNGTKNPVDIEAVAGGGWYRYIFNTDGGMDYNTVAAKFGLNFNFNFGSEKEWTISLKPAAVFDLIHNGEIHNAELDKRNLMGEVTAGITYHFKSSNGKRYQTVVAVMEQDALNALNARLKVAADAKARLERQNDELMAENARLKNSLAECEARGTKVITGKKTLESTVNFAVNSTVIEPSQQPNVERIATYLKNHVEATIVINGYASQDGPEDVNIRLANDRAKAVKDMLVNKYGIPASRIVAGGQGIGNMFEENDWNRVSICTIGE